MEFKLKLAFVVILGFLGESMIDFLLQFSTVLHVVL